MEVEWRTGVSREAYCLAEVEMSIRSGWTSGAGAMDLGGGTGRCAVSDSAWSVGFFDREAGAVSAMGGGFERALVAGWAVEMGG